MKLFRSKSNASTPASGKPNRLSRILGSNRSKVDVTGFPAPSPVQTKPTVDLPTNPFPSPQSSSPHESNLPPHLPPLSDTVGDGTFIDLPRKDLPIQMNSDNSIIDEHDMTRKLMDVESSFVPEERSASKPVDQAVSGSATRWPYTRSVSPDRMAQSQTYLNYGPGKVHHRTVTYNALEQGLDSELHSAMKPATTPEMGSEMRRSTEAQLPWARSPRSQEREQQARSQSRILDQSFHTAATNPRSDFFQTPTHDFRSFQKSSTLDVDIDELDYGDSPIEALSHQDLPSSPITAANLRKVGRAVPTLEPDHNLRDNDNHEETTPKQAQKNTGDVASQSSQFSSDGYVSQTKGTFYNTQSERSLSPLPRPAGAQQRRISYRSTSSALSGAEMPQRPDFLIRQTSQQSTEQSDNRAFDRLDAKSSVDVQQANGHYGRSSATASLASQISFGFQSQQLRQPPAVLHSTSTDIIQRPSGLQSRQTSQFSTISSTFTTDAVDEFDQGADYAIQTGGAMSADSSFSMTKGEYRRAPSFGSVASSIVYGSPQRTSTRFSKSLVSAQEDSLIERVTVSSPPETPRQAQRINADPTETVLAQHVRDVNVPETVARQYRANYSAGDTAENKSVLSTPKIGHGINNLTLKEQNSKIDKLTKENFDLKLKIHFLHQALQDRSDEGVRDLISKNAQLQTELVKMKKDNQSLRKRLRALEKSQQEHDDNTSVAQSVQYESDDEQNLQALRYQDEIAYFRDRARDLEIENGKLAHVRQDMLNEELARRKINEQEILRLRQDNAQLLERQYASAPEVQKLQLEIMRLKETSSTEVQDLQQEISRLKDHRSPLRRLKLRRSRPNIKREGTTDSRMSQVSESTHDRLEGDSLSGTTVVDQLKQENAELRRDLGAQTSMLTSRNRERERLQKEIEDLKLLQRHGDSMRSVAGDSILDRSVSRNRHRSTSRASGYSQLSDVDRDRYESIQARLRDENAQLRIRNQDLQREVNALDDLRFQGDADIEQLSAAIKQMELQLEEKDQEIDELMTETRMQEEESNAFRQELKDIGDSLNQVMDNKDNNQMTIDSLQKDLVHANAELEMMERNLRETQVAKERMEVQQESSQSEISFLREEQEADKIKIGELESSLKKIKSNYRDEQAILKDVDDLAADAQRAREEARRLRKTISMKEAEALASVEKLDELENVLRHALNDWDGSSTDLMREASQIRQRLEETVARLDEANAGLIEKEDLINERETLLDASNLEIRRLTDLVNSERRAYKAERAELEQRNRESGVRSAGPEVQLAELEYERMQHRRQLSSLEKSYAKQLDERNALLLTVWNRSSAICGAAWAKRHSLFPDQDAFPTMDSIAADLPRFNDTISLALKHIDNTVTNFRTKLNKTEDEIWQDFQKLDQALQVRFSRLDQLEKLAQRKITTASNGGTTTDSMILADLARFKEENKVLRRENKHLKQSNTFALPGLTSPHSSKQTLDVVNTSLANRSTTNSSVNTSPRSKRHSAALTTSTRLQSTSPSSSEPFPVRDDNVIPTAVGTSVTQVARPGAAVRSSSALGSTSALGMGRSPYVRAPSFGQQQQQRPQITSANGVPHHVKSQSQTVVSSSSTAKGGEEQSADDMRWVLRLEEMQKRLEREREGRLLDRDGARTRLLEERKEVEGLKKELARVKSRSARNRVGHGGQASDDGVD